MGHFTEVDIKSLPGFDPVRLKVACKDPSAIKGSSKVYFNGRGLFISWNLENEKNERKGTSLDKPSEGKADEDSWEDDGDEETDNYNPFKGDGKQNDSYTSKDIPESIKQGEYKLGTKQNIGVQDNVVEVEPPPAYIGAEFSEQVSSQVNDDTKTKDIECLTLTQRPFNIMMPLER